MVNELENFFTDLQKRKIIANYANLDNFYNLKPEEKIVYLGIDCTGERLHIGHLCSNHCLATCNLRSVCNVVFRVNLYV